MATHWAIDLGTSNTTVCVDVGRPTTVVAFDFGGGSLEAAVLRSHGPVVVETGRTDVLAKQAVARKLGLVQFGADVHVR
ncbi:MAG TPA: hypothetical protein DCX61_11350 [Gemmatimonadetes bacterium]|uniref:Hsp70 family protein n=1 Tax=marine metagenome TaxID=408172 RepID=A0A381QVT2_9ZZZZ|nr:hypothetical protein [Gemmatimonadota bacterium]